MADYSDAYGPGPSPTHYAIDVTLARKAGRQEGFDSGYEAALIAVARKRKKNENSPLRCPLCEAYMFEETAHLCPRK